VAFVILLLAPAVVPKIEKLYVSIYVLALENTFFSSVVCNVICVSK
jgi:hypothetical protein